MKARIELELDLNQAMDHSVLESIVELTRPGTESPKAATPKAQPREELPKAAPAPKAEAVKPKAAPKAAPAPEPEPEEEGEAAAPDHGIKIEDVRALLGQKVESHRAEIKSKLTELGSTNVTLLNPIHFPEFMDYLNSLD